MAVVDIDDGERYYAQLRGFLQDEYYQKSAVITWLVPSPHCSNAQKGFDPSLYIAGFIHGFTLPFDSFYVLFCFYLLPNFMLYGTDYVSCLLAYCTDGCGHCCTPWTIKNLALCFCQHLCRLLTDFQNSFTATLCRQFVIIIYAATR